MMDDLIRKVESFCKKENLLDRQDTVIVAVSGGPDSIALLHILAALQDRWSLHLVAAYVNHGLRAAAFEEEVFVESQARAVGAEFYCRHIDAAAIAEKQGLSIETAGRNERYAFFSELAEKTGAVRIAVGHHEDDQAETVLMHLLRGGGVSGAGAMKAKNGLIIRPLLCVSRQDILTALNEVNLPWRVDESNESREYLRNRIRHDIMPLLKNINPQVTAALNRFAFISRQENIYMENEAVKQLKLAERRNERGFYLDIPILTDLHEALQRRVVRLAVQEMTKDIYAPDFAAVERILGLCRATSGKQVRFKDLIVYRRGRELCFTRGVARKATLFTTDTEEVFIKGPGTYVRNNLILTVRLAKESDDELKENEFFIPRPSESQPLIWRCRRGGDVVFIRERYHKSLKKYFIEKKIPVDCRGKLPLLCKDNEVLWIFGDVDWAAPLRLRNGVAVGAVTEGDIHA